VTASIILDVQSFKVTNCATDYYRAAGKIRDRLVVNKQRSQRFQIERFNHKNLNEVDSKESYHVEVPKRFAALEDLDAEVEINSA
jgi:hypothetical protein